MADVPGWLLIANTVIVGALGFLPNLVEPKKDKMARASLARQQAENYLASKVEETFLANDLAASRAGELLITEVSRILTQKNPALNNEILHLLFGPQRLVAAHFPTLLPIFDVAREEMRAATEEWGSLLRSGEGNPAAAMATTQKLLLAQVGAFASLRSQLMIVATELARQRAKSSGVTLGVAPGLTPTNNFPNPDAPAVHRNSAQTG